VSKQEQLMEYITQDIILYIIEDREIGLDEALNQFYNSEVFKKLQDVETGLYLEGAAYVYDLYKTELQYGKLAQLEQ